MGLSGLSLTEKTVFESRREGGEEASQWLSGRVFPGGETTLHITEVGACLVLQKRPGGQYGWREMR